MCARPVARTLPVRCPYVARTARPRPPLPVRCPYVARTAPVRQTDSFSQLTLFFYLKHKKTLNILKKSQELHEFQYLTMNFMKYHKTIEKKHVHCIIAFCLC